MDDAPMLHTDKGKPDTTARHVLQAIAEHASKTGGNAHPSVLRIQYRTGYDRTTVQRALRRLEKGALIKRDGVREGRVRWQLAMNLRRPDTDWAALEREEEDVRSAAAERKRRSRAKAVTHSESVTVTDSEGVTVTGAESVTESMSRTQRPAVTDFKCGRHALNAALTTNQPSDNQLPKDSSSPAAQEDDAATEVASASKASSARAQDGQQENHHLEAFGAFWSNYPKKRDREAAKKAWIAAIERGVEPKRIVDAAQAYARERFGQEPQYTKYPATWLNKGCYDDEPDPQPGPQLRAVSGGYQPYRQPTPEDRAADLGHF
jgi:helix-turn-helix protein